MIVPLLIYIVLTTIGLTLLKRGMGTHLALNTQTLTLLLQNRDFLFGATAYGASFLTWLFLLSQNNLSKILPIAIGLVYVAIMIASALVLKEPFTTSKIIGVILIGIGVLFITR
ncbi:MAG: hypothetical protein HYV34_03005 [Candidatus Kerfeldbacteria bacterium]|nr:hypothetical protein [Candidatus Kerfeldbacteria bacterium]